MYKKLHHILLIHSLLLLLACTQKTLKVNEESVSPQPESVDLKFQSVPKHKDTIQIFSQTITQNITKDKMLHQKEDVVQFTIEQETTHVDTKKKTVSLNVRTVKKEGEQNLHDMAYPELNEAIDFVLTEKGRVLKAGDFPSKSLFYLSPIPLPGKTMRIGDTWDYKESWWNINNQSFMNLEIVLVLKKILKCFENETCVAIAWNGRISPTEHNKKTETPSVQVNSITSSMQGYMLYRLQTGTQLWSYIRNVETFKTDDMDLKVFSCIKSVLDDPKIKKEKPVCNANKEEFDFPF